MRFTINPAGTLLLFPLPKGIIQKVQRWSHPCWISIYARDFPSNFSTMLLCSLLSAKIFFTWIGEFFDKEDQVSFCNFSLFPITKSTSSMLIYFLGLICAAHPVTIIFFSGKFFFDLRIAYWTFFSAASVTEQDQHHQTASKTPWGAGTRRGHQSPQPCYRLLLHQYLEFRRRSLTT